MVGASVWNSLFWRNVFAKGYGGYHAVSPSAAWSILLTEAKPPGSTSNRYHFVANLQDTLAESLDLDVIIRARDIAACNTVADLCDKVAELLRQQGIEVS